VRGGQKPPDPPAREEQEHEGNGETLCNPADFLAVYASASTGPAFRRSQFNDTRNYLTGTMTDAPATTSKGHNK